MLLSDGGTRPNGKDFRHIRHWETVDMAGQMENRCEKPFKD